MSARRRTAPARRRHRLLLAGTVLLPVAAGLFLLQRGVTVIHGLQNGEILAADYRLNEEDFHHPRLVRLREREHLDRVVAGAPTQFDAIVRLRHWARGQWEPGRRFYYPAWDALEILNLARRNDNRGFCAQYAVVFLQACQAMGIHARYVDLAGHFTAGVWSDDFDKWVIMDILRDVHYERRGDARMILGGGQLCDAYWKRRLLGILQVGGDGVTRPATLGDLAVFRNYAIERDADQLAHPVAIIWKGRRQLLTREADYHQYPRIGHDTFEFARDQLAWQDAAVGSLPPEWTARTSDPNEFRYAENQTIFSYRVADSAAGEVEIGLTPESASTFRRFLVNRNGTGWGKCGRRILWRLKPGDNLLEARIETTFGWLGPPARIRAFWWPGATGVARQRESRLPERAPWITPRRPAVPAAVSRPPAPPGEAR